mgnify:CR=1 FL=1
MFDILELELKDFRSFAGTHSFALPSEPGLYNLTGRNLDNPRLEANATGKSTLLDAIHWCLYGRTSRGLKAGRVVTRGKKTCMSTVKLAIGKDTHIVERIQNPNLLTLNGKQSDQADINKLLRLSPEQFALSVMLPQFGSSFLDLGSTDKLALFSQIMELDFWLEKSKAADALAKELAGAKEAEERKLAALTGGVSAIHEDCKGLEAQQAGFANEQKQGIRKIRKQILLSQSNTHNLNEEMKAAGAGLRKAEEKSAELTTKIKDHQGEIDKVIAERQKLATKAAVLESSLQTMRNSLKKLGELDATCPTCLQTVNSNHLKAEKARLKGQIDTATLAHEAHEIRLDELAKERTVIARASSERQENLATTTRNKVDFATRATVLQGKLEHNVLEQEQLEASIKQEQKRENPYTKLLADKLTALADLKAKRTECRITIASLSEDHAAVSYWVQGFKRVRLFLVEETLRQLELEVNNNLASLGLLDWSIEFDVERENQSGGITKGFVVLVRCPEWKEPVQFEEWSGGETQRLRLAGDLGLSNLIMERAGLTGMIEFYDEPSKHMSPQGLLDLAETLHQRALATGKRIFLVDHHLIDFGDFAGVLTVIKDDKGSRLDYA